MYSWVEESHPRLRAKEGPWLPSRGMTFTMVFSLNCSRNSSSFLNVSPPSGLPSSMSHTSSGNIVCVITDSTVRSIVAAHE